MVGRKGNRRRRRAWRASGAAPMNGQLIRRVADKPLRAAGLRYAKRHRRQSRAGKQGRQEL